jgi:hypothetical protein
VTGGSENCKKWNFNCWCFIILPFGLPQRGSDAEKIVGSTTKIRSEGCRAATSKNQAPLLSGMNGTHAKKLLLLNSSRPFLFSQQKKKHP